jgi:hypothetical protein
LPRPENEHSGDKNLFIGLSFAGIVALGLVLLGFWYLTQPRLAGFHAGFPLAVGLGLLGFYLAVVTAFLLIVISSYTQRDLLSGKKLTVRILFPLAVAVGKMVRVSPDDVRGSFIAMNNALVRASARLVPGDHLLLLLPHCLQSFECPHRVTSEVRNCRLCGKCEISSLIGLCDRYGIKMSIATGGTLARRVIVETRPGAIVGVACERDLTSGIQDAYPIPVIGVLNERPHGPCRDTTVDLDKVEEAVTLFLQGGPRGRGEDGKGEEAGAAGDRHHSKNSENDHAGKVRARKVRT